MRVHYRLTKETRYVPLSKSGRFHRTGFAERALLRESTKPHQAAV